MFKKTISLCILLLLTRNLISQNHLIGLGFSPGLTSSHTGMDNSWPISYDPRISLGFHFLYKVRPSESIPFFFRTGFNFSDRGNTNNSLQVINGSDVEVKVYDRFVGIPLDLAVDLRFFYGGIGINLDYYLNTKIQHCYSNNQLDTSFVFQHLNFGFGDRIYLGFRGFFGFQRELKNNWGIYSEIQYNILFRDKELTNRWTYDWSVSLAIGLSYKL